MAQYKLIGYEKCSTCLKAKKFLEAQGVDFVWQSIITQTPSAAELLAYQAQSGLPWAKFFNTSGQRYRELQLKDKIGTLSPEACAQLLSSDGKLIKRPLLVGAKGVVIGFQDAAYREFLN